MAASAVRLTRAGRRIAMGAMFYDTQKNDHGLPYNPFKAIVAPRPIGWITSMSAKGEVNLAPYSFFNGITDKPPIVMFSSEGVKDSVAFAEETTEFVCSLATFDLRDQMNGTSAPLPRGENEMSATGLEAAPSRLVKPPRVAASPCALECKWLQTSASRTSMAVRWSGSWCSARRSASISTIVSSGTAGSTPPR
jgi:flavin reductase (DIM6/NTAB) family NADH-FMN oxidoreductase RutF